MKKLIIALVAISTVASADIYINYVTPYGFTDNSNANGEFLLPGETALIELINVGADGIIDTAGTVGTDDSVLGSFSITASATGSLDDFTAFAYTESYDFELYGQGAATVFARIYQDSTKAVGSKYYDGATLSANDVTIGGDPANNIAPPLAQSYEFGGDLGTDVASFATVIPEPATIGLMGIAAAGLFTARRKVRV